jgi:molybdopterin molybdotransferase
VIVSTGDEVIEVHKTPNPFQIRRSNNYTIKTVLEQHHIEPEMMHLPDDPKIIIDQLRLCLHNFDVIILTGGVSMGKFDYVPKALEALSVQPVFYKVQQRPGKPYWFGSYQQQRMVFAFPGNPVSTFLCLHRYFLPWLYATIQTSFKHKAYALLNEDVQFQPELQYFLQVKLFISEQGLLTATPVAGNGSGDFSNLLNADAFMELPKEKNLFKKDEPYPIWPFNPLL